MSACYDALMHHVVVVGGGFAGVRTALDLGRKHDPQLAVTLISDRPHFEYHAALYRVVAGRSPLEVCIPLMEIFDRTAVQVLVDPVQSIDLKKRSLCLKSGTTYHYDSLVLAVGSETSYFGIPGLAEHTYGFKTIEEAHALKAHLHANFDRYKETKNAEHLRLEIVGAGASGVELAGELAVYLKRLARLHKVQPKHVHIDLIEAAPRVAPLLPEDVSQRIHARLEKLGITILTSKTVTEGREGQLVLKDGSLKSRTVVWTAGIKPHALISQVKGLPLDKRGRVLVEDNLQVQGLEQVYAVGDIAVTQFGGMAQTAVAHGHVVAQSIAAAAHGRTARPFTAHTPVYALPVGPGWAAVLAGKRRLYGTLGWLKRRQLDWLYFRSILPRQEAWLVFQSGKRLSEQCPICDPLVRP
jgi:NADH dehydrogenase